ncbi:MAG: caspase domain-containing protein [Nodosilinea sp.]
MANHWPIVVGINQYQSLQPLMYAQFDAIELKDFLVNEAGLSPQYCALLTDISPMVYQGAAFPTREVILQRLAQTGERTAADDTVWFFFSGYGVHWDGQDYILPIDADPSQIPQTGILVETLFKLLTGGAHRPCLVMLDINRPQSALSHGQLGIQSVELAKSLGVPLILSCQPDQFSQETLAVRHGLFSEAMIEGLRFHGCLTLSQLAAYLTDRVPELCQHHWRPEQNPVVVIPPEQQFLLLVPPSAAGQISGIQPSPPDGFIPPWPQSLEEEEEEELAPETTIPGVRPWPSDLIGVEPPVATLAPPRLPSPAIATAADDSITTVATLPPPTDEAPGSGAPGWQRWGILAAGLLLLGVLLRNQEMFLGFSSPESPESEDGSADQVVAPAVSPPAPAASEPSPPEAAPAPEDEPEDEPGGEPLFPVAGADAASTLERARTALAEQQFGEALTWLTQLPEDQRPEDYTALLGQAQAGYDNANLTGAEALSEARRMIDPLSASLFNDAIKQARQVAVGDPEYEQAQADIARWSRVILDLAEGRAVSGNLEAAIAAAQLVPDDQGEIYGQAQAQIQRWQQRQINQQLLQQAQGLLQPDQATSFQEAIALAQQIAPDYPESAVAQERIEQWSRDILAIARARAADGQLPGAISAANLVPADTEAYAQAQAEIQRWQQPQ